MNRRWTIRARIITLLLAPLIPLLAMLIFATSVGLTPALNLRDARISVDDAGLPASNLLSRLQDERELSVIQVSLASPDAPNTASLGSARKATDAATATLTKLSANKSFRTAASAGTLRYLSQLEQGVAKLPSERAAIDAGIPRTDVMTFYNNLIQTTFNMYGSIASLDDHTLQQGADQIVGMAQASEFLAREDALVAGPIASGNETASDYQQIVATIGTQRFLFAQATRYFTGSDLTTYRNVTSGAAFVGLAKLEDQLIAKPNTGRAPPVNADAWQNDYSGVSTGLAIFEGALATRVITATGNAADEQEWRLAIAIGAGLLMTLVILFFSLRVARALIRRVARLREDALSLALDRLPSVMERLRRSEAVDLRSETPPLRYGRDELGQLGDAFTRVQETAITSAVQEANLRNGFNQVFLNIARRSQTLLHRQLALLDTMERRTNDPDELEELFRVDHLATRMRRHAEDLVILAGSTPGRGWRTPIPFADVLRAAASEVEEYARISVLGLPEAGLAGRAVNDVVHLLAELLENATMFSPPETQVLMSGQAVPNGFVIEIEDRGLGMSAATLEEANARLAVPPDFDPSNSSRLGLFVVARLAARHNIAVALRRSPYGGVTAVTLIPADLVVQPSEIGASSHGALNVRVPSQRGAFDDTEDRRTGHALSAAPTAEPRDAEATMVLTPDGLPKRSRQASRDRHAEGLPAIGAPMAATRGDTTSELPPTGAYDVLAALTGDAGETPDGPVRNTAGMTDIRGKAADRNGHRPDSASVHSGAPIRTPEQMRSMLASFQDGMTLGRRDAAATPKHAQSDESDETEPDETERDIARAAAEAGRHSAQATDATPAAASHAAADGLREGQAE